MLAPVQLLVVALGGFATGPSNSRPTQDGGEGAEVLSTLMACGQ